MRLLCGYLTLAIGILTCAWATTFASDPTPAAKPADKTPTAPPTSAAPQTPPARPPSVITSTVQGSGNTVIVSKQGDGPSVIITSVDKGANNRVIVHNGQQAIDLDKLSYKGKDSPFWSFSYWDTKLGCMLYCCPKTSVWFRYHAVEDLYRPALELYLAAANEALRQADRDMLDAFQRAQREMQSLERVFELFR